MECVEKFGRNADVDSAAAETVWAAGGLYPWASLATAQALEVLSADANDDDGDTGCRTVLVSGLDSNYDELTESVTLNGTAAVDLTNSFLRVNLTTCTTAGSSTNNEGNITLRLDGGGVTVAQIPAAFGQTPLGIYTVPRKHKLLLFSGGASMIGSNNNNAEVELYVRPFGGAFLLAQEVAIRGASTSVMQRIFNPPLAMSEKSDLDIRATVTANSQGVEAHFESILIRVEE